MTISTRLITDLKDPHFEYVNIKVFVRNFKARSSAHLVSTVMNIHDNEFYIYKYK